MIQVNASYCPQNHRCPVMRICPVGAIIQESPFSAPEIDQEKCIDCGKCSLACRVFTQQTAPLPAE